MKLKEYLPSFVAAMRMRCLNLDTLSRPSEESLPVVVTLTSIPPRLKALHLTIRSVLSQSVKPEKVVLWLHDDLCHQLPTSLSELQSDVFKIRYVDLTCSHRKLIHSLEAFPDKVLVTCDDDLIYDSTWLERLYSDHRKNPENVIAHECRFIKRSEAGELFPYKQWPVQRGGGTSCSELMAVGYGGVLYPAHALSSQTTDVDLFMKLAPKADDLWFKAMSFINGTCVRSSNSPDPRPIPIIGSQKTSLLKTNVREDGNRKQWQSLSSYFNIDL